MNDENGRDRDAFKLTFIFGVYGYFVEKKWPCFSVETFEISQESFVANMNRRYQV